MSRTDDPRETHIPNEHDDAAEAATGRKRVYHPSDVTIIRDATDETILGYLVEDVEVTRRRAVIGPVGGRLQPMEWPVGTVLMADRHEYYIRITPGQRDPWLPQADWIHVTPDGVTTREPGPDRPVLVEFAPQLSAVSRRALEEPFVAVTKTEFDRVYAENAELRDEVRRLSALIDSMLACARGEMRGSMRGVVPDAVADIADLYERYYCAKEGIRG